MGSHHIVDRKMKKAAIGLLTAAVFFGVLLLSGCATRTKAPQPKPPPPAAGYPKPYRVFGKWYQPLPDAAGFRQRGIASWYGKKFHGRKTSNGEIYDMYAISAAHKTLPFDTYVRVRNLDNGRTLDVRINDRGPFVRGRIIDLSYTAAKKLGVVGPGTAPVEIAALGARIERETGSNQPAAYIPLDYDTGNFTFQVGAFKNRQNAENLVKKLSASYKNAHIQVFEDGTETFFRVRVGNTNTRKEAEKYEAYLIQNGFVDAFMVAE